MHHQTPAGPLDGEQPLSRLMEVENALSVLEREAVVDDETLTFLRKDASDTLGQPRPLETQCSGIRGARNRPVKPESSKLKELTAEEVRRHQFHVKRHHIHHIHEEEEADCEIRRMRHRGHSALSHKWVNSKEYNGRLLGRHEMHHHIHEGERHHTQVEEETDFDPPFQHVWEEEFRAASYMPQALTCSMWVSGTYFIMEGLKNVGGFDDTGGGRAWVLFTWCPCFICGFLHLILATTLSFKTQRSFFFKNHDSVCFFSIFIANFSFIFPMMVTEYRRSVFQRTTSEWSHITWGINYSSGLPERTCKDNDPMHTWTENWSVSAVGCNNSILAGGFFCIYLLLCFLPYIYRMSPRAALLVCLNNIVMLISAVVAVGTTNFLLLMSVSTCQVLSGISAAFLCGMRTANERKQFAVAKAISGVSELNRNLLHAFIPPQLLHKLTHQKDRELLAGPIHCMSVMFCQVEPRSVLTGACSEELFSLLNAIFTEFDYVVKSMGMFKYQHVGGSYIVACPRALSPFHPEEQDEPYPSRHAVSMAELATELQQITMSRNFQGVQLYLKVGIACGPAAGSFMGKHRRFYCLVGDVMNTASRMCSHASDKVHCTASFAAVVRTANCLSIQCECRGIIRVKGKGDMETFELSRRQRGLPACQSLASTQFTMSLNRCVMSDGSVHDSVFSTSGSLLTAVSSLEVDCKSLRPEISSWLEDPKNSISSLSIEFCNEELEERFCKDQCTVHGHRMVVGLVIHLFALGLQWFHTVHPEYDYFFVDNGSPDLKSSLQLIHVLLLCNIYVTTAISIVSGCAIVKDPLATKQCVSYFCLVKVMHVVVSLAGCKILPGFFGWLAIFTAELICMDGFLGTLTFKRNFVLTVGTVLVISIFLTAFKKGLRVATLLKTIWWGIGSLTLSRTANFNQHRQWRMLCVYRTELRLLRQRLCDLLPRHIAVQNLVLPTSLESLSFQRCKVTVLQLDLCGSTAITALYPPLHIAGVLHNLFSKFDQAVQDANLFKMDILGDGYIVIGFPSTEDFTEEGNATHQSKHSFEAIGRKQTRDMSGASNSAQGARMLCLAHLMIDAVREVGKDSGLDLHCRIGISTGEVIAGTLGRLQPRFHIMGEGMRLAEQLEQTSEVDSVHVSTKFLEQLGGSALSTDDTDGGHIKSVAQFVKTLEQNALLTLETCGFGDGWTVSSRLGFSIPASEISSGILQKVTQEHTLGSSDTHMAGFCSFSLRPSGIPAVVRKKRNREASNVRDSVQTQVTTRKYL